MKTWGYRIATILLFALFGLVIAASYYGWGVKATATTTAERERVRAHSARVGGYVSGGPRYGK